MKKQYFLSLLSRKLTATISDKENEQLQQAITEHQEYRQIADQLTSYFKSKNESGLMPNSALMPKLENTWEMIAAAEAGDTSVNEKPAANRYSLSYWLKIAAVLVLFGAGLTVFFLSRQQTYTYSTLTTSNNKIFKTLDDGTKLWLRQGSEVKYNNDFGKTRREIFLTGEAFFDVTKNRSVPLLIHVRNINIEVKGTAFNVTAYQKNVEVSLFRGLVEVTNNLDKNNKILLKPMQKLIVNAGQQVGGSKFFNIYNLAPNLQQKEIKWTLDSLVFKKEKLKDLAVQLERRYDVKIEIQDEKLKTKRFSGVLKNELLTEALDALKLSYPFDYTIKDKLVIIKQAI